MSENISADELMASLTALLEKSDELDIQDTPEISDMREQRWGRFCSKVRTPGS